MRDDTHTSFLLIFVCPPHIPILGELACDGHRMEFFVFAVFLFFVFKV